MRSVTIKDVALHAGVSKKTVSRVINKEANVKDEMRQKVQEAIDHLGFKRNPLGMALAKNRSFFIALLADNPSPGYIMNLQKGIMKGCREEQMGVFLYDCSYRSPTLVEEIESFIDNTLADGLILAPPLSDKPELLDMLDRKNISYVQIGAKDKTRGDFVDMDAVKAAYDMTSYLLHLKHRDIGFILGHPDQYTSQRCEQGYRMAFADANLKVDESLIVQGYYTYQSGVDAASVLLNRNTPPSAIFASNDEMAVGVLYTAQSRGISVPKQLSIASIDDTPIVTKVWPNITTMRHPLTSIGYRAATFLIGRLKHKHAGANSSVNISDSNETFHCDLVIRESTTLFTG
ncbi:conserved hypothetical protein [Alteromonas sp. 38]|uniref:LacI family DNA-binding transcriptional regulator n=1 Tax=Alteromonas TaxID=226 RepID=UPI0012EFAF45|nr:MULTISPECIES: LacI family DNA-binding transcriptional regulator [Alteromonas]CAD5262738.1 conserved hypothetical protein [Alteromonas sp. 154]VXC22639.1 conserved hypothetical protein [Alteromonas sp. 38]